MLATSTFNEILEKIKTSNLNFHIQLSPFSAMISLKKTLVRDRSGNGMPPPFYSSATLDKDVLIYNSKNQMLQNEIESLKCLNQQLANDLDDANKKLECMEIDQENKFNDMSEELSRNIKLVEELSKQNVKLSKENSDVRRDIKKLKDEQVDNMNTYAALENKVKGDYKKEIDSV